MTAVTRAKTILDAAFDETVVVVRARRIADRFAQYRRSDLIAQELDPDNLTDEQKAQAFLDALRDWGRSVMRAKSEEDERATQQAAVLAAGNSAEADF